MKTRNKILIIVIGALLFGIGGFIVGTRKDTATHSEHVVDKADRWTCSMHPQIQQATPGKCPLCGMDLIPSANNNADNLGERMLTMSPAAMKLAEVQTQPIERRFIDSEISLAGIVDYDETRVKTISAWVAGRLDRLFVDYTGIPIKKGEHLVEIYSPELYTAQEELIQAIQAKVELQQSASTYIKQSASDTVAAVREKLSLLGLQKDQISNIETTKKPTYRIEITSPISGIVIKKNATEGIYVKKGTAIYTVADLTTLWVKLDAYESDLALLKYGQDVEIRSTSFGNKIFKGWISFIDPIINPATRTVKVRVVVDNQAGMLKPNMFVTATVKARIGQNGAVPSVKLKDKWICPMHPEVISDKADTCPSCGMKLVQAETLGYNSEQSTEPPLIIPSSAALITGERALVYIRLKNRNTPTFEGREVKLGSRAGNFYIVYSGIKEGEDIVINGNFNIDSALQLIAKPSMMSADTTHDSTQQPEAKINASINNQAKNSVGNIVQRYYIIEQALVADDHKSSQMAAKKLADFMATVQMGTLSAKSKVLWSKQTA
ncbi:MAG: efflux RND transporter periplasmic adaptor subunit, partial [Kiritimatiellae bacterium]|nr:efflux RND transporter periplasmic adaptor subunit [Kiritimatiellia bacterium]